MAQIILYYWRERERERDAYMHIGPRYILGKLGAILKDST